jgi:hypothetical protein
VHPVVLAAGLGCLDYGLRGPRAQLQRGLNEEARPHLALPAPHARERVAALERERLSHEDGSGVDAGIDEVHGDPNGVATVDAPFRHVHAPVRREEAVVGVYRAQGRDRQNRRRNDVGAHEHEEVGREGVHAGGIDAAGEDDRQAALPGPDCQRLMSALGLVAASPEFQIAPPDRPAVLAQSGERLVEQRPAAVEHGHVDAGVEQIHCDTPLPAERVDARVAGD